MNELLEMTNCMRKAVEIIVLIQYEIKRLHLEKIQFTRGFIQSFSYSNCGFDFCSSVGSYKV